MRACLLCILFLSAVSCADQEIPQKWLDLGLPTDGLAKVSEDTDEHGYYADYEGMTEQELKSLVENAFDAAGYQYAGDAFDGLAWGYKNDKEQYAVKIEYTGSTLHLSIFNEKGSDPLIHGVIFSKYSVGEKVTGEAANEMLLNDQEEKQ